MYHNDLPTPELTLDEIHRWKIYWQNREDKPSTCLTALKACDQVLFSNVHTLLKIACTLPITSCECERSASMLRRLRNYMRATMSKERLTSLALIHTHYEYKHDYDQIVDRFSKLHPRRMELENIIYQN